MTNFAADAREYYAEQGMITDPAGLGEFFIELPDDISELCGVIQGQLLHVFWAERYGEELSEKRTAEAGIRHVESMLARLQEIEAGPLIKRRPLGKRLVGNCRTFSVLLAAMLRSQGVPARARCGFGRYFQAGWHEDHWVCEYWNGKKDRWVMVDAQLDDYQCEQLGVEFDPLDLPHNQFIVGGKAWLDCREGRADPSKFGIFDMRGLWFVRGNLVRDFAALNKVELLPWDSWGLIDRQDDEISHDDLALLDSAAEMTKEEVEFAPVRSAYETNADLKVPTVIKSYTKSGVQLVHLAMGKLVE
jgi:hypothetical protein